MFCLTTPKLVLALGILHIWPFFVKRRIIKTSQEIPELQDTRINNFGARLYKIVFGITLITFCQVALFSLTELGYLPEHHYVKFSNMGYWFYPPLLIFVARWRYLVENDYGYICYEYDRDYKLRQDKKRYQKVTWDAYLEYTDRLDKIVCVLIILVASFFLSVALTHCLPI